MRKVVYAVLGLMALLAAAAVVVPFVVDLDTYKGPISARVKAMTGRDLTIAGSIDFSLLPTPAVTVNDVRLANVAGAAVPDMVRLKAAEARVALWALLRGVLRVETLTFVEPLVDLEILADGSSNWLLAAAEDGAEAGAAAEEGGGFEMRLDGFVVEDATVIYRDSRRGLIELIDEVDVAVSAESLAGPFNARGGLVARGADLAFKLEVGALEHSPIAVGVELDLASAKASLSVAGTLSSPSADAEFAGTLKASGASLADVVAAFDPVVGRQPWLARSFSLAGAMSGSAAGVAVDDIELEFGGVLGSGVLYATLRDVPQLEITLAVDRIDFDQLLAESAAASEKAAAGAAGSAPFALPAGVNATVDLTVDSLILNRSEVRRGRLVATLDQGLLTLQQASALLPGEADVTAFGVLDSVDDMPRFTGQVEGSAGNLRAVLDWLGVPAPPVPADLLRELSFATKIEVTPELASLAALDVRLDGSHLGGGVSIEFRPRPRFTAVVALDRFDLDAYLRPAAGGEQSAAEPQGGPLGALAAVDGDLKAHVGTLLYKAVPISGLVIDAALKGGKLTLRRIAADDFAGARGTVKGVVEPAAQAFNLTFDADTADVVRLLRVFDVASPMPLDRLGRLSARGRINGDLSSVTFDTTVALTDAQVKLAGTVSGIAARPAVAATVEFRGENLQWLVRRFGADSSLVSARADGPYSLAGTVKGDAEQVEVAVDLSAVGARAKVSGTVTGIAGGPGYDVAVTVSHPDLAALAETFFDGAKPARRGLGEVRVRARAVGDMAQARVSILDASIGPTRLKGYVAARWDGARPSLDADLVAGELVFDVFAPVAAGPQLAAGGGAARPQPAAERWSREPIDFSGLRAFDAKLRLAADALKFRKHRFEAVTLSLTLADGVVEVDELAGRLYGAPIMITARFADAEPPSGWVDFRFDGADLRALLVDQAGVEAVSGRLNLSGRFRTQGRSEFELVSALAGEAAVDTRDGTIQGLDLALLNKRLGALDNEADFVRLVEVALSGGATRIQVLRGNFIATGGVLRSNDLRVVLDGGQGRAEATVDLPRWQLALDSAFSLADHPNAPLVGIALSGPIDNPMREIRDRELRAYFVRKLLGGVVAPKIDEDPGRVGATFEALTGARASQPAPQEAPADGANSAQPDAAESEPRFDNVLKGIIKDLDN